MHADSLGGGPSDGDLHEPPLQQLVAPGRREPPAPALVAVPARGFTVTGLDLTPEDVARAATSDLIAAARCYAEDEGFVIVETDPSTLAAIQAEIDSSNSAAADASTRLTNRYTPPNWFVKGNWSSGGGTGAVSLALVDERGQETLGKSASAPADSLLELASRVGRELAESMCCTSRGAAYSKSATLEIDGDYDIPNPTCKVNHQTVKGTVALTLKPGTGGPSAPAEYTGEGDTVVKANSECRDGVSTRMTCAVRETAVARAARRAFLSCDSLVVHLTSALDCTTEQNFGAQALKSTSTHTYTFNYQDGATVDGPVEQPILGHYRLTLRVK